MMSIGFALQYYTEEFPFSSSLLLSSEEYQIRVSQGARPIFEPGTCLAADRPLGPVIYAPVSMSIATSVTKPT